MNALEYLGERDFLVGNASGIYGSKYMGADFKRKFVGILSGSFNPLHVGHIKLKEAAERYLGGPVAYELTVRNADKGELTMTEVKKRLNQGFSDTDLVLVTAASTFEEKAALFNFKTFVVGYDTAERVLKPKYYTRDIDEVLWTIAYNYGCDFLVAERGGKNLSSLLEKVPHPWYNEVFRELEGFVNSDVSSTKIREERERAANQSS